MRVQMSFGFFYGEKSVLSFSLIHQILMFQLFQSQIQHVGRTKTRFRDSSLAAIDHQLQRAQKPFWVSGSKSKGSLNRVLDADHRC